MRTLLGAVLFCFGLAWWTAASAEAPVLSDNGSSIAVVIGNRDYKQTSAVDFAHNDAEAMKAWLIGALGFREQNIFLLKDATLGELNQAFGTETNPQGGRLWRSAVEGRSNVFVYYSGHGVPDLATRQPFLLPQDGSPGSAETGYALQTLYRNLELVRQKIGPQRQLIVMIDACFTGETGRKGESLLAVSAPGFTPAKPRTGNGIVKLVATSGATPANWDQETKLGLFTSRFLMGAAGLAKAGDAKAVALTDLKRYLGDKVRDAARRDGGREQVPEIDDVSLALPVGTPVAAVAGMVASERDEEAWQRAQASGERLAIEDYVASCGKVCRYREAAMNHLDGLQRDSAVASDRLNWQRLGAEGRYSDYLKGCGSVCAYRALAEGYLNRQAVQGNSAVRKCDELAGDPYDGDRNPDLAGVDLSAERSDEAITVCQQAIREQPQLRRLFVQLGRAYSSADRDREAAEMYGKAVDAGSAAAAVYLAVLLESGSGVPKNEGEARRLLEMAARAGNAIAMNNLGNRLSFGGGGAADMTEARRLLEKAAQTGLPAAMNNLALMLEVGSGGAKKEAEARQLFEKAAQGGETAAMMNLARVYEDGVGGPKNLAQARHWLKIALQNGEGAAEGELKRLQQAPKKSGR